jgi:hypothetical protein
MDYDTCSRLQAKNAITYAESVAACESIAKNTITKTHVEEAGLPKIPIAVNCGSRTKYTRSCLRQEHSIRYFLSR